jgi:hypothetical protein
MNGHTRQHPVELLHAPSEEDLHLDLPAQVPLEVNRQWRTIALQSQPLWHRSFLSTDAILGSLKVRPTHAHGPEVQTVHVLRRVQVTAELETTFLLVPTEPSERGRGISFLCITMKPDTMLLLISASLSVLFHKNSTCPESTMVARARRQISIPCIMPQKALPLGTDPGLLETCPNTASFVGTQIPRNVHEPLIDILEEPSTTPKSFYLYNTNQAFILHVSTNTGRTHSFLTTVRIESDCRAASLGSLPPNLERFPVATLTARLKFAFKPLIGFRLLYLRRFNSTSMDAPMRLNLPRLRATVVNSSQGNILVPTPPLRSLGFPTLKLLQTTALDPPHAPNRDSFLLSIATLKQACADNVLHGRMRPHHPTLRGPLQDTHLSVVLRFLVEKLVSTGLGNMMPSSKFFGRK